MLRIQKEEKKNFIWAGSFVPAISSHEGPHGLVNALTGSRKVFGDFFFPFFISRGNMSFSLRGHFEFSEPQTRHRGRAASSSSSSRLPPSGLGRRHGRDPDESAAAIEVRRLKAFPFDLLLSSQSLLLQCYPVDRRSPAQPIGLSGCSYPHDGDFFLVLQAQGWSSHPFSFPSRRFPCVP